MKAELLLVNLSLFQGWALEIQHPEETLKIRVILFFLRGTTNVQYNRKENKTILCRPVDRISISRLNPIMSFPFEIVWYHIQKFNARIVQLSNRTALMPRNSLNRCCSIARYSARETQMWVSHKVKTAKPVLPRQQEITSYQSLLKSILVLKR